MSEEIITLQSPSELVQISEDVAFEAFEPLLFAFLGITLIWILIRGSFS